MHSSTMKVTVSELSSGSGVMQTTKNMLRDHHQRHSDLTAQQTETQIQQVMQLVEVVYDLAISQVCGFGYILEICVGCWAVRSMLIYWTVMCM